MTTQRNRRLLSVASKLDRRTLQRGASGVLLGLPLLEVMRGKEAHAAGKEAKRIITFFQPNGGLPALWASGSGTSHEFGPILEPLAPHKQDVILLRGIDNRAAMTSPSPGDDHETGTGCLFTGTENAAGAHDGAACHSGRQCTPGGLPGGVSIDQVVAARVSTGLRFKSLELGSRVHHFSKAFGIISNAGMNQPLLAETSPRKAFDRIFSDDEALNGGTNEDIAKLHTFRMSVLDAARESYATLSARLGADDRARIDEHQTQIRELEGRLLSASQAGTDALAAIRADPLHWAALTVDDFDLRRSA